jgi:hypothetical protein
MGEITVRARARARARVIVCETVLEKRHERAHENGTFTICIMRCKEEMSIL